MSIIQNIQGIFAASGWAVLGDFAAGGWKYAVKIGRASCRERV